jgi:lipopolysaccharide biosynthesis regulator YciM
VELTGPDTNPRSQAILGFLENERGVEAMRAGQLDEAARRFGSAIDLDPSTTPAYLNLGDVRARQGDIAAAVDAWEQLLATSPDRAYLAFDRLSRAHADAGAPLKFEERCQQLIASNPGDWRARVALGRHRAGRGDHADAFEILLEALAYNPHGLTVHEAIWNVMLSLGLSREHVNRYITAARDAVFFLDPHICVKCHYRSTELLWQCPHCHEWNTFVEERIAPAKDAD